MNVNKLEHFLDWLEENYEEACISWIHGMTHWRHVEKFGLMLASECPGADRDVIRWFAYIHDCMRTDDGECGKHGPAAARLVGKIRNTFLSDLTDGQIATLKLACRSHTTRRRTGNLTADICLDADRLDLPRVMIKPDPRKMASEAGKKFAEMDYEEVLASAGITQ